MRKLHLEVNNQTGCKASHRHIGAYCSISFQDFSRLPADRQCSRCISGKLHALMVKNSVAKAIGGAL